MDTGSFIRRLALILGISVGALVLGLNSGHYKLPSQDILKGSRQDIALAMGVLPGIGMPAAVKGAAKPVSYIASASNTQSSGSSMTVSTPTGAQGGDLLVFLGVITSTVVGNWDNPPSSGWTTNLLAAPAGTGDGLVVATKTHDGSTGSWTFTSGSSYRLGSIAACRGGVFDVAGSGTGATNAAGSYSIASVTLAKSGSLLFALSGGSQNSAPAVPTGFTGTVNQNDSVSGSMDCYYKTNVGSGATGTVAMPCTASNAAGVLVGIKPA